MVPTPKSKQAHSIKHVGVISDTHGLMREQALVALANSDLIIHAGDVGAPDVLEQLRRIAPVRAVRGNNDRDEWARVLPLTDIVEAGGHQLYLLHDIAELEIDPVSGGMAAVVTGHSHKAGAVMRDGVLYLNPGSAGPRRFKLPVTVARLRVYDGGFESEIINLDV